MTAVRRKKSSKRRNRGRLTNEQKFQRVWQRVQNQQRKNDDLRAEIEAFVTAVEQQIGRQEQQYAEALYRSCQHLISFYPRKSLALWQREILLEWCHECLMTIVSNPFSTLDITPLEKQFQEIMESVHPAEEARFTPQEQNTPESEDEPELEQPETGDMFEDLFAEFDPDENVDVQGNDESDDPFEEFIRAQQDREEELQQDNKRLNQLLKRSSVNRLFRRVARVLHPDREQDAEARKLKTQQMAELLEARDKNDIARLISFYSEYVGESPLTELGGDLDTATQLLQRQYEYLRDLEEDIIHENSRSAMIYERFHERSEHAVQKTINGHLTELKDMIANEEALVSQITTLKKLKPLLEQREAMMSVASIFNEFDEFDVKVPF